MSIDELKKIISDFTVANQSLINELKEQSKKTADVCRRINDSWSGSSLGHHGYYYYGDFSTPPPNSLWNVEWGTIYGVPEG